MSTSRSKRHAARTALEDFGATGDDSHQEEPPPPAAKRTRRTAAEEEAPAAAVATIATAAPAGEEAAAGLEEIPGAPAVPAETIAGVEAPAMAAVAVAAAVKAEQHVVEGQAVHGEDEEEEEEVEVPPDVHEEAAAAAVAAVDMKNVPRPYYETIRHNPSDPDFFKDYLFALISFKATNGNFSIHKDECPNLYTWLGNMKREYSKFTHQPASTTMTVEQRKVLDFLHVPLTHRGDDHWNRFYGLLESYKERHQHVLVPRVCEVPGLGDWVTDQRRQHKAWKNGKQSQLTKERREKLEKLGFAWQVRNRPEWEQRFNELVQYKKKYGDCKVPQHFRENKSLGKWVAKQREQFKLKKKGQHSFLTPDREEKLNSIGFAWSVRSGLTETDEDAARATLPLVAMAAAAEAAVKNDVERAAMMKEEATEEVAAAAAGIDPLTDAVPGKVANL